MHPALSVVADRLAAGSPFSWSRSKTLWLFEAANNWRRARTSQVQDIELKWSAICGMIGAYHNMLDLYSSNRHWWKTACSSATVGSARLFGSTTFHHLSLSAHPFCCLGTGHHPLRFIPASGWQAFVEFFAFSPAIKTGRLKTQKKHNRSSMVPAGQDNLHESFRNSGIPLCMAN